MQSLVLWLSLSFVAFSCAVQKTVRSPIRFVLTILYLFGTYECLAACAQIIGAHAQLIASFILGQSMHATGVLFRGARYQHVQKATRIQRLRASIYLWTDFRRIPPSNSTSNTMLCTSNRFACNEVIHILSLALGFGCASMLFLLALRTLDIRLDDFAPDKRGFLPLRPISPRDITLRILITAQWIMGSYASLTIAHRIAAIFFVSVLRWDDSSQWPPLFGSIAEAYSLRRFWGKFWHKLHFETFAYFTPRSLLHNQCMLGASMRAGWIFLLSALCHVIVNALTLQKNTLWQELWFWSMNYVVCSLETLWWLYIGQFLLSNDSDRAIVRSFGYSWVFTQLICMSPGWQYPWMYEYGQESIVTKGRVQ
jgi:hypothetical protein